MRMYLGHLTNRVKSLFGWISFPIEKFRGALVPAIGASLVSVFCFFADAVEASVAFLFPSFLTGAAALA